MRKAIDEIGFSDAMQTLMRIVFSLLFVPLLNPNGLAQSYNITTYAGFSFPANSDQVSTQPITSPDSIALDGAGGFYFATSSENAVYHIDSKGTLAQIAGTRVQGFSGDGGPATSAKLYHPQGIVLDAAGNLFIADSGNCRIRKVTAGGIIITVAGVGGPFQSSETSTNGDGGPATSALLFYPYDVAIDPSGNLIIADTYNHAIRKVTPSGTISTVAGSFYSSGPNSPYGIEGFAGDGGLAIRAYLAYPKGIAIDAAGNLFIADTQNARVRKVTPAGIISTVAGSGDTYMVDTGGFGGDGGPATSALLKKPTGVAVDAAGNIFVADFGNNRIRKVTAVGTISTIAGNGAAGVTGDRGPASLALLDGPSDVAVDQLGNVFVADAHNNRVRQITLTGVICTVAGDESAGFSGDGGSALGALMQGPRGIVFDRSGNLIIADTTNNRVRKITPSGIITTIAGDGTRLFQGDNRPAISAQLDAPWDVAVDSAGNLYIADAFHHRVRKVTTAGIISTVAGNGLGGFSGDGGPGTSAQLNIPSAVAVDAVGNLFIADTANSRIRKVTPSGVISTVAGNGTRGFGGDGGPATAAMLSSPYDLAIDPSGNLIIADLFNSRVRRVSAEGIITTVVQLVLPTAVAVDASGNLFVSDEGDGRIRMITTSGDISVIAGNGSAGFSGDGGPAGLAQFRYAQGLAVDAAGNLFIADTGNNRVRKLIPIGPIRFNITDRGGVSYVSAGQANSTVVGYASIQPDIGRTTPSGLAIFGFRQNNVFVTEAAVPAVPLIQSGRIYAEMGNSIDTGIAIANPNKESATVSFFFSDANGSFGNGTTTIPANGQIARFLDQSPFNAGASLSGAFSFSSSTPIAVIALRGHTNERGEFLITTLPVVDLSLPVAGDAVVFPQFVDGGGWSTQIVLVNPTDRVLTGTVQFRGPAGQNVTLADSAYSIPARASQRLQTLGTSSSISTGSVRIIPAGGTAPTGAAIFSFRNNGITVAEAGVSAVPSGTAFRLYAEASGDFSRSAAGSIQTGIAVANTSSATVNVTVDLTKLDGSAIGLTGILSVPANGQTAIFLNQIPGLESLQTPLQGVMRVSSAASISLVGLRGRYNERGDFLIATTPPMNEAAPSSSSPLFYPHIADSGGYTTQFILFSAQPGSSSSGTMQLFNQSGSALGLTLR
jgi:sugar lactone lactonase YvrE